VRDGKPEGAEVNTSRDEEFRSFVVARRGGLLRTATLLSAGDRHAAEDLVQTALMRVYVAWPRVRRETVDAYTRKALLNAMIDNRRRPFARFERSHAAVPEVAIEDEPSSDPESEVFAALAALPPRMRAAVVLRHLCQLSVTETAETLNCSEGTVKSQTARALAQLRDALRPAVLTPAAPSPTAMPPHASPTAGLHTDRASVDLQHAEDSVRTPDHGDSHE
jgi:RNA polymerase sigma-70 factor (sigma-E family)